MTHITPFTVIIIIGYFVPALVAYKRGHQNTMAITAVNILLGWTALGWIAALVWSLTAVPHPKERKIVWMDWEGKK